MNDEIETKAAAAETEQAVVDAGADTAKRKKKNGKEKKTKKSKKK